MLRKNSFNMFGVDCKTIDSLRAQQEEREKKDMDQ